MLPMIMLSINRVCARACLMCAVRTESERNWCCLSHTPQLLLVYIRAYTHTTNQPTNKQTNNSPSGRACVACARVCMCSRDIANVRMFSLRLCFLTARVSVCERTRMQMPPPLSTDLLQNQLRCDRTKWNVCVYVRTTLACEQSRSLTFN